MAKFKVRSMSVANGKKIIREKIIDTSRNTIFKGANTFADVAARFEAFWAIDRGPKVKVTGVIPVKSTRRVIGSIKFIKRKRRRK